MIVLENVSKTYNPKSKLEVRALKNFSYCFEEGKFYSIMGPSGSGKSTLLNILALLSEFDSGDYTIDTKRVEKLKDKAASKLRNKYFGFVMQDYALLESETVNFNITLPAHLGNIEKNQITKRCAELLGYLNIAHLEQKKVMQLSGGEKQRVAIARALINSPKVILADEPTGALDYENGLQVIKIFQDIAKKSNVTVIMVSHNQEFASLADETLRLKDGELIQS